MQIKLSDSQSQLIQQQLAGGTCKDASDVIEAGLRLLEAQQQWRDLARQKIENGILDADAGRVHEFDAVITSLANQLGDEGEDRGT